MAYLTGIDLGTSSLKVIIMDDDGVTHGSGCQPYQFESPTNGYAEQHIDIWWQACCSSVKKAMAQLPEIKPEIVGIGISGQMHGAVFLDKDMQEVRPAILHCDARSGEQVTAIQNRLGEQAVQELMGNPVYTGFLLPSLLWVRENEPKAYERIRHVLLPKDYLRFRLTGELCSDYSDASATLAFDLDTMDWSREIFNAFDIPHMLVS